MKVGFKIPGIAPNVIWLTMDGYGFPEGSTSEYRRMEDYAKEICRHMNSLNHKGSEVS